MKYWLYTVIFISIGALSCDDCEILKEEEIIKEISKEGFFVNSIWRLNSIFYDLESDGVDTLIYLDSIVDLRLWRFEEERVKLEYYLNGSIDLSEWFKFEIVEGVNRVFINDILYDYAYTSNGFSLESVFLDGDGSITNTTIYSFTKW